MVKSIFQNDRFLKALHRQPVDCTPVWMMRQAGRYLPEYRNTRARAGDFLTLCKTPELACEVTLQPLARFDLDAAILFSDILTIPDAMGLGLTFSEGEGPKFKDPIREISQIAQLPTPDPHQELRYVMDAVRCIKQALGQKLPLIGFCGSPWTLATYMIEGGSSKDFSRTKQLAYDHPIAMQNLLAHLSKVTTNYLNAQIEAGVDAVMIFDTWGGVLTPDTYEKFSLQPLQDIMRGLVRTRGAQSIPSIFFSKFAHQHLEKQANVGVDALSVDWTIDIGEAKRRVGHKVALQGNMDPTMLCASDARIQQEVRSILDAFGPHPGHVFNLGHGITPDIDPEKVNVMVEAVHHYSRVIHSEYNPALSL